MRLMKTDQEGHILKHGVESWSRVEPWSGVDFGVQFGVNLHDSNKENV